MTVWAALAAVMVALSAGAWPPAAAAADHDTAAVELTFDQERIDTTLGRVLTVQSRITNLGNARAGGFVAHLNVTSLDPSVYVDLEDWSADVTRKVEPLEPGGSTTLTWDFQAVNAGTFNVYVVLLPDFGPLVASPPVRVEVAQRRALHAGGALPVVIAVPVLLGLLAFGTRYRLRHARP
jgi:hypothetical protein